MLNQVIKRIEMKVDVDKIPEDIQEEINITSTQLRDAIRRHQILVRKLEERPEHEPYKAQLEDIQNEMIAIGEEQKIIVDKLRAHYKNEDIKKENGDDENNKDTYKSRKQHLQTRGHSYNSSEPPSDDELARTEATDSEEKPSADPATQEEFLSVVFQLCTHQIAGQMKEHLKKRVERLKRSTALSEYLYNWDPKMLKPKRKRKMYLRANFSPPNTRSRKQRVEECQRLIPSPSIKSDSPLSSDNSRGSDSCQDQPKDFSVSKRPFAEFNLPSGLTIERVKNSSSPELKSCITCRLTGALLNCEKCDSNYHMSCHTRTSTWATRFCPKCLPKRESNNSDATANGPATTQLSRSVREKLIEKRRLLEKKARMMKEMTALKERRSELFTLLKCQDRLKGELEENIDLVLEKIDHVRQFVAVFRKDEDVKDEGLVESAKALTNGLC